MDSLATREARADQPAPGVVISPLQIGDVDDILAIAAQSFSTVWAREDFEHFIRHEHGFSFGMSEPQDGRRTTRAYFISLLAQGDVDVISVATAPAFRQQGLAEGLLRHVFAVPQVARVFLEVDVNNQAAIALYQKLGFATLGIRKKYYQQKIDAMVMRWQK